MARFSTKHGDREKTFSARSFSTGLNQDLSPLFIPLTGFTKCMNMRYVAANTQEGEAVIAMKIRQGTEKISSTALGSAVQACTYYNAQSQYIVATASKVYYLNASGVPVEIGSIAGIPTFTEFHGKLIIHDGGVTKAWNGTTLETLNDLITDENIGTGNNSDTEFSHTIDHSPIKPSTVTIEYTDSTAKTITDDGNGRLAGDVSSGVEKTITGASNGYPCVITASTHGYSSGDVINIQDVEGMTNLNNASYVITRIDADNFSLNGVNSLPYSAYTSGGTASSNAVKYSTGAILFTCSGAPDNTTAVTATYEKDEGAPKSKAGLVRASRLYVWGDSDNPSRLWYSAPNDEGAWDSSSSGGYLDCNPLDGYEIVSVLNFFQSLLIMKESGAYRLDNFPGDSTFRVEPLITDISCRAYRTALNESTIVSFLSDNGWEAFTSTQMYGDITKGAALSKAFSILAKKYSNASAIAEYNQQDNQFWLNLHNGTSYLNYIHVVNMDTGGQLSHYKFKFGHACFKYANGMMLIGGSDGHLYKLLKSDTRFRDNAESYASDTYITGAMSNFGFPKNRKHQKYINPMIEGGCGATATFRLYKDNDYDTVLYTTSLTVPLGNILAYDMSGVYAYDMTAPVFGGRIETIHKKFNYHELMWEITNITGSLGVQINGCDFAAAVIGD